MGPHSVTEWTKSKNWTQSTEARGATRSALASVGARAEPPLGGTRVLRVARALALASALAFTAATEPAWAFDTEVHTTSAAQAYSMGSPLGPQIVRRRRFLQTLALEVHHLEGDATPPGEAEYAVRLRLRLDSDTGVSPEEAAYSTISNRFVPGLIAAPVDIMYGYLEGRHLLRGWLGFRLGRQYVTDSLGWWGFDGGQLRLTTPFFVAIEAYGGVEQRGGLPLSSPRFEQNGVWRGEREGFARNIYPQFLEAYVAPAYGAAIESAGITFLHGRFDYRKVLNRGPVLASAFPNPMTGLYDVYDATRVSSERLGYALDAILGDIGGAKGAIVYDLYDRSLASGYVQLDWYASQKVTAGADFDYFRPTFDGDSIFTFFTHNPMTTMSGRVAWDPGQALGIAVSGGARSFFTDGDPATFTSSANGSPRASTAQTDVLGDLSGRLRFGNASLRARGMIERGEGGHRQGGDIYGERRFMGGRWMTSARVSLFDWQDNLRADRSATSFAYVLGGGFRPSPVLEALVEWEHDMNRLVGQRYRLLAIVSLTVTK